MGIFLSRPFVPSAANSRNLPPSRPITAARRPAIKSRTATVTSHIPLPRNEFLNGLCTRRLTASKLKQLVDESDSSCSAQCSICLVRFDEGDDRPIRLHDNHVFGEACIREWLSQDDNNTCPLCRVVVCEKPKPRRPRFYYHGRIRVPVGSDFHHAIESAHAHLADLNPHRSEQTVAGDNILDVCEELILWAIRLRQSNSRTSASLEELSDELVAELRRPGR